MSRGFHTIATGFCMNATSTPCSCRQRKGNRRPRGRTINKTDGRGEGPETSASARAPISLSGLGSSSCIKAESHQELGGQPATRPPRQRLSTVPTIFLDLVPRSRERWDCVLSCSNPGVQEVIRGQERHPRPRQGQEARHYCRWLQDDCPLLVDGRGRMTNKTGRCVKRCKFHKNFQVLCDKGKP